MKKTIKLIVVMAVVLGVIYGIWFWQFKHKMAAMAQAKPQPPAVSVATAVEKQWLPTVASTGQLAAYHGVTIRTEGSGVVTNLSVKSGQVVKAHQVLVILEHGNAKADWQSKQEALRTATAEHHRYQTLARDHNVSQQALDMKRAAWRQAQSDAVKAKGDYDDHFIKAPFACRLGILKVYMGQLLSKGDPVVNCEDTSALKLVFSLPQQYLSKVQVGQAVHLTADAYGNTFFDGKVEAISPRVSEDTRSIRLEVRVNNRARKLLSGMFVAIHVPIAKPEHVIMVPHTAVHPTLYGDFMFLVDERAGHPVAKQVKVTLGQVVGTQVIVKQGIQAGAKVVSLGQATLRDGSPIRIVPRPASSS